MSINGSVPSNILAPIVSHKHMDSATIDDSRVVSSKLLGAPRVVIDLREWRYVSPSGRLSRTAAMDLLLNQVMRFVSYVPPDIFERFVSDIFERFVSIENTAFCRV